VIKYLDSSTRGELEMPGKIYDAISETYRFMCNINISRAVEAELYY